MRKVRTRKNHGYADKYQRRMQEFGAGPVKETKVVSGKVTEGNNLPLPRPLFQVC